VAGRRAHDADAGDVTSEATAITKASDVDLTGGLPERAEILKLLDIVLAVTVGLLAIAVLIALIGVGNTLSLSCWNAYRRTPSSGRWGSNGRG
jgi:putative ABC transport system permease protein